VTIAGGTDASTSDRRPRSPGPRTCRRARTVTVDLADETLTTTVGADGGWTATAGHLADGPHRIIASATDAAGNRASFTQSSPSSPSRRSSRPTAAGPAPPARWALPGRPPPAPGPTGAAGTPALVTRATVAPDRRQRVTRSPLWVGTQLTAPTDGRVRASTTGSVKIQGTARAIALTRASATIGPAGPPR
jgi:hypothetical protein